jgi:class 3 adenylate cyclase/tetratricopeptide (TPR) repeat protein
MASASCAHANPPGAKFCAECGAPIRPTCRACGTVLPPGAKFCTECAAPVVGPSVATPAAAPAGRFAEPRSYTPKYLAERILTSRSALEGERKHVTVLFADLRGSMELLADRDPEEARTVLDAVLQQMMDAVHRYEGTVNQVMGDGIMALFGAPLALEDHAVRACYAALRMQETIRRYAEEVQRSAGIPIQVRIGVNSGEVLVRSVGSDLRMDYTAVGQTTHLAARLEQTAMPGSILISAETLRLVEDYVEVKPLGLVRVKGLAEPLEVFEVTGAGSVRTRLQRATARGLTRFVGRDAELEQLRQALAQAAEGRGQIVAVVGEPGVGKSRLFYEFLHSHRTRGWLILQASSVSFGKASAYLPVLDMLRAHFKIDAGDEARTIRAKVTGAVLTLDEGLKDTLPPLLGLLDALAEDHAFHKQSPSQRRQSTLDTLKRLILREAQAQPVLLVFEDLHWIDSETQALLDALVESLPGARLLLAVNYRPEYRHGWSHKTFYHQIPLEPLSAASAEELLHPLLGDDPSLAPLVRTLIARTDGNPLFLEECVRGLVDTGVLVGERGRYRLAQPAASIAVPPSVQAILASRIDRLPADDKQLLQAASVIGKDVPFSLLTALIGGDPDEVRAALGRLQASELLYEAALFPELEYTFKHALTHEVAYGGMLLERRRALHARMVEAIEARHADRLAEHVERLAHHAFRGELWSKAARYARQAGERAAALCADAEAVAHYQRAMDAVARLPATPETVREAIDLRLALRAPLWRGGQLERLLAILREAESLGTEHNETERLDAVYSFFVQYHWAKGEYAKGIEYGHRCVETGARRGDLGLQVTGRYYLGGCHHARGEFRTAIEHFQWIVDALSGPRETQRFDLSGLPFSGACAQAALCFVELGEPARAEDLLRRGEAAAGAANHLYSKMPLSVTRGRLLLLRGEVTEAIRVMEPVVAVCRENNFVGQTMRALTVLGEAYALAGRAPEAVPILQEAIELQERAAAFIDRALWVRALADAYRRAGRLDEAERTARSALDFATRHGEQGNEAWAHFVMGEIAADARDDASARGHMEHARAMASRLGMQPLVAHCEAGLAAIAARAGAKDEARAHLEAARRLFTDVGRRGAGADLRAAAAALGEPID